MDPQINGSRKLIVEQCDGGTVLRAGNASVTTSFAQERCRRSELKSSTRKLARILDFTHRMVSDQQPAVPEHGQLWALSMLELGYEERVLWRARSSLQAERAKSQLPISRACTESADISLRTLVTVGEL